MEQPLGTICDALGITRTTDVNIIIAHIQTLRKNFKEQVRVATGIPTLEQIEGKGPPIG